MNHTTTLLFIQLLSGLFCNPRFPKLNKSEPRAAMDSVARDLYDEIEFITKSKRIKKIMRQYRGTDFSRRDVCLIIMSKFKNEVKFRSTVLQEIAREGF